MIMGAGSAGGSSVDIANLMKPILLPVWKERKKKEIVCEVHPTHHSHTGNP